MTARRTSYRFGAFMGDLDAWLSGDSRRILKRYANKWIGRNIVSKLWFR